MGFLDVLGAGSSLLGGILGSNASNDAADAAAAASKAGVAENRRQFNTVLNLQAPAINTGNAARSMLASILGIEQPAYSYNTGGIPAAATPGAAGPTSAFQASMMTPSERYNAARGIYKAQQNATQTPGVQFNAPASTPMTGDQITAILEKFPGYRFAVDQATKSAQAMGSATGSLGGNVVAALGSRVGGQIAPAVFGDYLNRLSALSGGAQTATNAVSGGALATGDSVAAGLRSAGDARASGIAGSAQSIGGALNGIGYILGNRNQPQFERYTGNPYGNVPFLR